jgi:hypothetical protein
MKVTKRGESGESRRFYFLSLCLNTDSFLLEVIGDLMLYMSIINFIILNLKILYFFKYLAFLVNGELNFTLCKLCT